ncbi:MAG: poly-gamma-glutamate hydrolase family protein [Actinobacteria bacterium]|nr:poly-gamma-glutamate hydrolase family protein [Actinomycetota bacterium]
MTHASFRSLLQSPGVREVCELRGPVGFMAYHGGALEEMTDVIARHAAEASDASYYGVLQPEDLRWHIPSHKVSPDESPTLQSFIDHVKVVVTVHGYGRDGMWTTLLLGGQNRDFAEHVAGHLRPVLPQYTVETTLRHMPRELRGLHEKNPVNLPPLQGVQIELPPRIRGKSPIWKDWQGGDMVPHMRALIDGLAAAARAWSI